MNKVMSLGLVAGVSALVLSGCSGVTATAEFAEDNALEVFGSTTDILKNPSDFLSSKYAAALGSAGFDLGSNRLASNKTEDCAHGGTVTTKVLSETGDNPDDEGSENGSIEYTKTYDSCNDGNSVRTGMTTKKKELTTAGDVRTVVFSGTTDNTTYKAENGNKYVVTSNTWSGTYSEDSKNHTRSKKVENTFSGELTLGKRTIKLTDIVNKYSWTDNETEYIFNWDVSGAVDDSKYGGVLVYDTPTLLKIKEAEGKKCFLQGKLVVKGKDHTVTAEIVGDKVIKKFDDKTVESKESCSETNH